MLSPVLWFLSVISLNGFSDADLVRETLNGRVQGLELESLPGRLVEQYLGIPYARPPTGKLRFEVNSVINNNNNNAYFNCYFCV